jgi:hypothetical protein
MVHYRAPYSLSKNHLRSFGDIQLTSEWHVFFKALGFWGLVLVIWPDRPQYQHLGTPVFTVPTFRGLERDTSRETPLTRENWETLACLCVPSQITLQPSIRLTALYTSSSDLGLRMNAGWPVIPLACVTLAGVLYCILHLEPPVSKLNDVQCSFTNRIGCVDWVVIKQSIIAY